MSNIGETRLSHTLGRLSLKAARLERRSARLTILWETAKRALDAYKAADSVHCDRLLNEMRALEDALLERKP